MAAEVHANVRTTVVARKRRWTRESICAAAIAWNEANGRPPRAEEWRKASPSHPSASYVYILYDSWNHMLSEAELEDLRPFRPRRDRKWTRQTIIERAREWRELYGSPPAASDWENPERRDRYPTVRIVTMRFNSWERMLVAAGLAGDPTRMRNWTVERTIEACREWTSRNQRAPSYTDWKPADDLRMRPTSGVVLRLFSSWEDFLTQANVLNMRVNSPWSVTSIVEAARAWTAEHSGQPPQPSDWVLRDPSGRRPTMRTVYRHFGSWPDLLNQALGGGGLTP